MIHRVGRHRASRTANTAATDAYGARLETIFKRWVGSGRSAMALADLLQAAAKESFPGAFLKGKQQALKGARVTSADQHEIETQLASNYHYLRFSLESAIIARKASAAYQGTDESEALESSFASRVRLQYGGRLWQLHEAGHQAGTRDLAHHVRLRMGSPPVLLEDDEGDGEGDYTDAELAAGLGLTLAELLALIGDNADGSPSSFRVGTEYSTEDDGKVCDDCQSNRDDGEDGVYWLPDEPPLPGSNCQGGQNCRCWLSTTWSD